MAGDSNSRQAGALLERPQVLMLLSVGALLVSGGTLAALHLMLQPGRFNRRAGIDGLDEEEENLDAGLEAIAKYDLEKSLEEELALVLSDLEPDSELEPEPRDQQRQQQQRPHPSSEYHPDGRRLSRKARARRRRKGKIVGPHIESFPQQERGKQMVKIGLLRKEECAVAARKCNVCWMTKRHCICGKLPAVSLPLDFIVLLHYKEYLRISNTGHLLPLMHKYDAATDTGSELLIKGVEEADARLAALEAQAQAQPYSVIALMPSDEAITLHDLIRRRKEAGTGETGRLKVILLDGTWRQGRALNRRLSPHVTRVKLAVVDRPSQFRLRRRTRADGICTIEAAALTVMELGEERGKRYDEVIDTLNLLNETVLLSTNKPPKEDEHHSGQGKAVGKGTTRRPPLPPLQQPLAGGANEDSFIDYEDAQSSLDEWGEEDEDDDLVVFESPEKASSALFAESSERVATSEAE